MSPATTRRGGNNYASLRCSSTAIGRSRLTGVSRCGGLPQALLATTPPLEVIYDPAGQWTGHFEPKVVTRQNKPVRCLLSTVRDSAAV